MNYVPVYLSPQFTKLYYEYIATGATTRTITLKDLDFDNSLVSAIDFTSLLQYIATRNSMTSINEANYYLGDYFLAVRSDSLRTEEVYQFVGEYLIYMRTRTLSLP